MVKRMNKRGQSEGFTLVQLLIGVVVLAVVISGIFYVVKKGSEIGENIPGKVEIIKQACALVVSPKTIESYCNQIREIGNNKYVTCDYAAANSYISVEGSETMVGICDDQESIRTSRIIEQCSEMNLKDGVSINGNKYEVAGGACTKKS